MADRAAPRTGSARRQWTRRTSLTVRILAVNIIALALMAGSLFYLDSYRKQLLDQRFKLAAAEAEILADGLDQADWQGKQTLARRVAAHQQLRVRIYHADGLPILDSNTLGPPAFTFVDPAGEPFLLRSARRLDRAMNFVLGADPVPAYRDPASDSIAAWPELAAAQHGLLVELLRENIQHPGEQRLLLVRHGRLQWRLKNVTKRGSYASRNRSTTSKSNRSRLTSETGSNEKKRPR